MWTAYPAAQRRGVGKDGKAYQERVMAKFTAETAAAAGRKGGLATVARHGHSHMQAIGARGFASTVARHWGGDRQRFLTYIQHRGLAVIDPFPQNGAWQRSIPKPDSSKEQAP